MQDTLKARFHRALSAWPKTPALESKRVSVMYLKKVDGPRAVKLPDGTWMTRADLPPADTSRWVASRKLAVLRGVVHGLITQAEAEKRYGLSAEEFQQWARALSAHGAEGLKVTASRVGQKKKLDNRG